MEEIKRPNPEELLAKIQKEETNQKRGKLKIFFGSSPGVGKTYAMLEEALAKLNAGIDVAAGIVESHGRVEIEKLLVNFEKIPKEEINYHGRILKEFNLDGTLKRHPQLVLVDELAHTNLPNLRHSKRFEDIEELLANGIDVYTSLNVQHLESLNDVVFQITGIEVKETVPDSILEKADAVELIDIPIEDLLARLEAGKVYARDQAQLAAQKFFSKGNLVALRELALRITAEKINKEVLSYKKDELISQTWAIAENFLVCISYDADYAKLIRTAKRVAGRMQAKWTVAYLKKIDSKKLTDDEKHSLNNNLNLAARLGAQVITLESNNLVDEIGNYVRDNNITKIFLAKENASRWKSIFFHSLNDELAKNIDDADIYLMKIGKEKSVNILPYVKMKVEVTPKDYFIAALWLVFATIVGFSINEIFYVHFPLIVLYLLGIIVVSLQGAAAPAYLMVLLSNVMWEVLFLIPSVDIVQSRELNLPRLLISIFISFVISRICLKFSQKYRLSLRRGRRMSSMYLFTRKLVGLHRKEDVFKTALLHFSEIFDCSVSIFLVNENMQITLYDSYGQNVFFDEKERSVAQWSFDIGHSAGLFTKILPYTKSLYVPIVGTKGSYGIFRFVPFNEETSKLRAYETIHLLENLVHQAALALETCDDEMLEKRNEK